MIELRREPRRPGSGAVRIWFDNPEHREVSGRLVDVSDSGFRMSHDCALLQSGQMVEFRHVEATGRARVVWNRIVDVNVETGFLVLAR